MLAGLLNRIWPKRRKIKAGYDAAETSTETSRHWSNADGYDAVTANAQGTREKLRKRSRYEVKNNCYARGIINTLANDIIGTGPLPQVLSQDSELNARCETAWSAWCRSVNLAEKLRTMCIAKKQDGEAVGIKFTNTALSPVSLDFRLIECDQVASPFAGYNKYTDGIRFDKNGKPAAYYVLNEHPGIFTASIDGGKEIAAEFIMHWFRTDRPGQIRGVPEITPALPLFAQLRRYTLAVISAAELAAEWTAFMHTNNNACELAADIGDNDFASLEVERGMMTTLPEGWLPTQLKPEQPATTYDMFKHELLNEVARCFNMPYNIAACNSSGYNYASGRLDHQTYYKNIAVEQSHCESVVLDDLFGEWLAEWRLVTGVDANLPMPHQWIWPGHEHVDPAKEATANQTNLASLSTNLRHVYAARGLDWETEIIQLGKEKEILDKLGLSRADLPALSASVPVKDDE